MARIDDELDVEATEQTDITEEDGVETEQVADGDVELEVDEDAATAAAESNGAAPQAATEEEQKAAEEAAKAEAAKQAAAKDLEEKVEAFKVATEAALQSPERDTSTGTLPTGVLASVTGPYSQLPGTKARKAALTYLQEKMQEAMLLGPSGFLTARTYLDMYNACDAVAKTRETVVRVPVDPTEDHVSRVAALMLAPNLVPVGEGVAPNWGDLATEKAKSLGDQVVAYRTWLLANGNKPADEREAAPEVDSIVQLAAKLAAGRVTGAGRKPKAETATTATAATAVRTPFVGQRGNIAEHIKSAVQTVNVGDFMTIADIVNHESGEYGGDKPKPSAGAVAARLFPAKGNCTLDFVRPEGPDQGRDKKGAVRTK